MRRFLLYVLYGSGGRGLWALEQRCAAAGVHVAEAMTQAGVYVWQVEINPAIVTKRQAAAQRLRRHWPRLPEETAHTLVRIAVEGMRGEEAGW